MTKYPTLSKGWTPTGTQFRSRQVTAPRSMLLTMKPEHRTSSYQRGTASTSKHIGSSNWPKGKWQGSLGSMFQGKPHLSQKCMLPRLQGRKTPWDPSMPCQDGSSHYSWVPQPTMACYSNMSKSLTTGGWLERSCDSDSLSTTYRTSAFKLPIIRLSSEECCRLKPQLRGIWSSPISTTTRWTYVSSVLNLEEQHEPTNITTDSGGEWIPSR
jgi:hypothetical protein